MVVSNKELFVRTGGPSSKVTPVEKARWLRRGKRQAEARQVSEAQRCLCSGGGGHTSILHYWEGLLQAKVL